MLCLESLGSPSENVTSFDLVLFFVVVILKPIPIALPCSLMALSVYPKVPNLQVRSLAFRKLHSRSGRASHESQHLQFAGVRLPCLLQSLRSFQFHLPTPDLPSVFLRC